MSLEITKITEPNKIKFKNGTQVLGAIEYTNLTLISGSDYSVYFEGQNVEGDTIELTNTEIQLEGSINPTTVFWAIAAVLKEVLCPTCV